MDAGSKALELWEGGQAIVIAALRKAQASRKPDDQIPDSEQLRRLRGIILELRKQLRKIEADVEGMDANTWAPWRASEVYHILEPWDLESYCQASRGRAVNWPAIEEWAGKVRQWFGRLDSPRDSGGSAAIGGYPPFLEKDDVRILESLASRKGIVAYQVDLTAVGRDRASERLNYLESLNYVQHPPGKKKRGWLITESGIARLAELPAVDL